jgi:hypothetical protein
MLLSSLIEKSLPASPVVLAEPVKNPRTDRINWFSRLEGALAPLGAAPGEERAKALQDVENFDKSVKGLSLALTGSGDLRDKKKGELLAGILKFPESREYYWAAGKIAVVGWGMRSLASLPVAEDQPEAAPGPARPSRPKPPPKGPEAPKPPKPPQNKELYEAFSLKGFLGKAALGAALGLIAALIAACVLGDGVFRALMVLATAPKLNAAAFDGNEKYLADLRKDLEKCRLDFHGQRSPCLIFSKEDASLGNLSFLDGCWESRPGALINAYDGQAATFGFCYGARGGEAKMSVKGVGAPEGCVAPAKAAYQGEDLTLAAQAGPACGPGRGDGFPRYSLRCAYSPEGAQASCELTQFDEHGSVFPVEFRRMPH